MGCFGGGDTGGGGGSVPMPSYSPAPTSTPDNTGTIEGTVYMSTDEGNSVSVLIGKKGVSKSSTPVEGALLSLVDLGKSTYSDSEGKFKFENVPEGQWILMVSYQGRKSAGTVTVVAGKTTVVTIELPNENPTPTPDEDTGTLRVIAQGFYEGDKWVTVSYIRVWEYGNYSRRWYNSWDELGNEGQVNFELDCYNAPKNKYYVAEVGWHNGDTITNDTIYLYQDDQTVYIYHY